MASLALPARPSPPPARPGFLLRLGARQAPALRLVAFPYAGGGASSFARLARALPAGVEVLGVQLPGRENRLREKPFDDLAPVVDGLLPELLAQLDDGRPFALFGHSLGALLAFETARALRRRAARTPSALIVAGRTPPQVGAAGRVRHVLDDDALLDEIRRLDGIPAEVAEHREMLALMLPALRGDLAIDERYVHTPGPPLRCPILAMGGRDDPEVSLLDLALWRVHTSAGFALKPFPGAHFFLNTSAAAFASELSSYLLSLIEA